MTEIANHLRISEFFIADFDFGNADGLP